ncbi:ribose transport system substrate-binding protein [Clostridium algifaecis]|uniref:Ribose transport system substrate-binding protein n=1 Tax=Clostridium algifaecis TaxID=1472040 RepID=A0ABS4KTX4_9CLOT|nr:ribose ABC transporter substrate-binding protein RbsB [Clostridium algifaecis]MBP2033509.1 ribose transport system substrate-binding protein [Clostridium algifaecis]
MKKKLLVVISVVVLVVGMLSGCGSTKDNKKLGMIVSTLDNPFFVSMKSGAEKKAKSMGYDLVVLNSRNDPATERSNVEDLVQQGVGAIIINPTDSDAVANSIKVANDSKIPVLTVDRQANGGKVVSFIASDNVKGGKMAAEFILNQLKGKANIKIVELQGTPGASASRDRGKGFHEVVDKKSNVKVVASQAADFDRQKGLSVMENIIQSKPEFDAVFAQNDEMALGAVKALKSANKHVVVVGFDGTSDGEKSVKAGDMTATVAQQPVLEGETAIENAIKASKKQSVEKYVPINIVLFKK